MRGHRRFPSPAADPAEFDVIEGMVAGVDTPRAEGSMMSTEDAIKDTPWGDVSLLAFSWAEDGRDVVLRVVLPGPGPDRGRQSLIVLRWAGDVVVRLEGGAGPPLTWDTTFQRGKDGRWAVVLDFASHGEIRVTCAEIEVVRLPG